MKHHAPVWQVHEDHPALKGDGDMEGVAHRRFEGGATMTIDHKV
jgi:hypothetical protein